MINVSRKVNNLLDTRWSIRDVWLLTCSLFVIFFADVHYLPIWTARLSENSVTFTWIIVLKSFKSIQWCFICAESLCFKRIEQVSRQHLRHISDLTGWDVPQMTSWRSQCPCQCLGSPSGSRKDQIIPKTHAQGLY